ncbi:MAG: (2Fe-2S)-binding protein [Sandaracinaceae bacterium]|nr:(2Fe-2S)-binding protein [Sandaracinaceae bacterium]
MPTFKLNDKEIPFEPGETIIRAAWKQGIEIPHYCWHPGLSVAANCRMCLVEVKSQRPMMLPILKWDAEKQDYVEDTKPKLAPACQQAAAEGMEVSSTSDQVKQAQASVQEFLLLNHPVDCPICDQAGECKLQDYWLDHQKTLKRKQTEPVHKVKGVRFGPTIVYDGERCVMCTRCIRFNDEIVGDPVLDMRERGNTNEIVLSPGRQLDHKYSLMNEHVCPVGALTSRDFRFKARVWFLKAQTSVCSGCATGCNMFVDYDPRDQHVYRLRPRDNEAVNKHWMCDDGMLSYHRYHQERIVTGRVRTNGHLADVKIDVAMREAAALLATVEKSKIGVVLSAQHSSEDNFVLAKLAREKFGTDKLYLAALPGWDGDKILRHNDNNPNRAGATLAAGGPLRTVKDLLADVASGAVEGVIALGWASAEDAVALAPLSRAKVVVSLSSNEGALPNTATVVLPVAVHVEMSGTFVNAKGMAQPFKKAIQAPPGVKSAWETTLDLARAMGLGIDFAKLDDVRRAMPANTPAASNPGAPV